MKEVVIHHFLGENVCATIDDVENVLNQSVNGVNEFLIAQNNNMYPYLTVLINGLYANVTLVSSEESAGFEAFSDDTKMDFDPDGISIFYTNTPSKEIEISNDYVIPKNLAIQIAKEFVDTGNLSDCVEWDEL